MKIEKLIRKVNEFCIQKRQRQVQQRKWEKDNDLGRIEWEKKTFIICGKYGGREGDTVKIPYMTRNQRPMINSECRNALLKVR